VVNEIIVRTINGGEMAHAGEFRALGRLLGACTGTHPAYRQFCVRVLLSSSLDVFDYAEGLELFDTAIRALPNPDRTLVHHKGLWVKDKGQDPMRAKQVLSEALITPSYPYSTHSEADELIHTSLAAATLKAVQIGALGGEEGRREALAHLDKAQSRSFFNPSATHVEARVIRDMLDQTKSGDPDRNALLTRGFRSVDRALSLLRVSTSLIVRSGVAEDIQMLEGARTELLARTTTVDEMQQEALSVFARFGRQDGFVVAARMMYAEAQASDRGTVYFAAHGYLDEVFAILSTAGAPPRKELLEVALDIYYNWRVSRRGRSGGVEPIDWDHLRVLSSQVVHGPSVDPFHEYVHGLALAHLREWGRAEAIFANLRRSGLAKPVLWARRDRYLAADGRPLRVQGIVRDVGDQRYVYVDELKTDFRLDRNGTWPRTNELTHADIEFAFGGPIATRAS
jgi:hypothetical protein